MPPPGCGGSGSRYGNGHGAEHAGPDPEALGRTPGGRACRRRLSPRSALNALALLAVLSSAVVPSRTHGAGPSAQVVVASLSQPAAPAPVLRVEGRNFVDGSGRVVMLRGVNLTGDAKVPPFLPRLADADLDRIATLGMNVVRLLFIWEAYEPQPGRYDEAYLNHLRTLAEAAWSRGIHVIVDVHQDGFSRHASRGAGDGFPAWALSSRCRVRTPDNSPRCRDWALRMFTDPTTHRSFNDFFEDVNGVRTRYLTMLARLSAAFAGTPGVIGYDLMNEPWGHEQTDLASLYHDAACLIRARQPWAILFLEGQVSTNCGLQSRLPRPAFGGVAYAPHYYKPSTIAFHAWFGSSLTIDLAFSNMETKAEQWNAPLFLGEFGCEAGMFHAGDYVEALYDRLDSCLASGAQWNYTPGWDPVAKDGWNGEDFNILDATGTPRGNFRPRPYPRLTAGRPLRFVYRPQRCSPGGTSLTFTWDHRPELGATELFVPRQVFPPGTTYEVSPAGLVLESDEAGQRLICRNPSSARCVVRLTAPLR
jgi:endoglycosylceramidase